MRKPGSIEPNEPNHPSWWKPVVRGLAIASIPMAALLVALGIGGDASSVINHLLTILTIGAGVVLAVHQLEKQHESARRIQESQFKTELNLRIFERISILLRAAQEANSKRLTDAMWACAQVKLRAEGRSSGHKFHRITKRHKVLLENEWCANKAVVALVCELENWELGLPGSLLFRRALSCALHDLQESQSAFFEFTLRLLPMELGDTPETTTDPVATPDDLAGLYDAQERYCADMHQLSGWLRDISTEVQMALLGSLFEGEIARRIPLDPSVIVLDTRKYDSLMQHFENNTAQARCHAETIREVREAFSGMHRQPLSP